MAEPNHHHSSSNNSNNGPSQAAGIQHLLVQMQQQLLRQQQQIDAQNKVITQLQSNLDRETRKREGIEKVCAEIITAVGYQASVVNRHTSKSQALLEEVKKI